MNETAADPLDRKLTAAWGGNQAERLLARIDPSIIQFRGRRVLDFGCAWGYLSAATLDNGACSADGVDIVAHWQGLDDPGVVDRPGLTLHQGDLRTIPDLQDRRFDVVLSFGTLFLLNSSTLDGVLAWFYDHLEPGGLLALSTRTVAAKSFNDLGSKLAFGGAQLLFPRRLVEAHLKSSGVKDVKRHVPYTGGTFALACRSAGFDILKVVRGTNRDVLAMTEEHSAKLGLIDPVELATGEILVYLQVPKQEPDVSRFRKNGAS